MLLVNNHKLKMAAALTPGREYNRRAVIIEGLRAERSPMDAVNAKINRRNDRWLAHDHEDVPIYCQNKMFGHVHVLGVVSSDARVSRCIILLKNMAF